MNKTHDRNVWYEGGKLEMPLLNHRWDGRFREKNVCGVLKKQRKGEKLSILFRIFST